MNRYEALIKQSEMLHRQLEKMIDRNDYNFTEEQYPYSYEISDVQSQIKNITKELLNEKKES
jgi:hypothetical protein